MTRPWTRITLEHHGFEASHWSNIGDPGASDVELPVFIDVHDVMRSMKCSRTMAYGHMRAALGRAPGERGHLRVPLLL